MMVGGDIMPNQSRSRRSTSFDEDYCSRSDNNTFCNVDVVLDCNIGDNMSHRLPYFDSTVEKDIKKETVC